jgi:hypothetical protein
MPLKPKKLRRISNNSERARTAARDEPDAVAVPWSGSDPQLARELLGGYCDQDRRGRLRSRYLKEGSQEEVDARRAIARLLRSNDPLDRQLRTALAGLFDPDGPPALEQRKISIVWRRRGGHIDHRANTQIAEHIRAERIAGKAFDDAIESAVEKFSVSEELAKQIWGRYRPLFENVYGPLPRRSRR